MSPRDLNPQTRRRLRRHAGLLTLWCVGIGRMTSWLLLHALHVMSPSIRYAISAVAMYSLGLVVGARVGLVHVGQAAQSESAVLGRAGPGDATDRWLLMQVNPGGASIADLFR